MRIGVPKEIKAQESRVGLTPDSVKVLTSNGHEVLVKIIADLKLVLIMINIKKLMQKLLVKLQTSLMTRKLS